MTPIFSIGIDVGKDHLDVGNIKDYLNRYDNTHAGHKKLIKKISSFKDVTGVYVESTGHYSRAIVDALHEAGLPVFLVQPGQVRRFAQSMGQHAKTDEIDTSVIALFGEQRNAGLKKLRLFIPPDAASKKLRALADRRDQVVSDRTRESNRMEACCDKDVKKRIQKNIQMIKEEIQNLDILIADVITKDDKLCTKSNKLRSLTGVGPVCATTLLAYLPELGTVNRQHICALSGLAPYDNSSCTQVRTKHIFGGRARIRQALYMAALSGVRSNTLLMAMHLRLVKKGKPKKVSITACARKLLVCLNSLLAEPEAV